eukprot:9952302-Alexandrium_andersonii.AAC.1
MSVYRWLYLWPYGVHHDRSYNNGYMSPAKRTCACRLLELHERRKRSERSIDGATRPSAPAPRAHAAAPGSPCRHG